MHIAHSHIIPIPSSRVKMNGHVRVIAKTHYQTIHASAHTIHKKCKQQQKKPIFFFVQFVFSYIRECMNNYYCILHTTDFNLFFQWISLKKMLVCGICSTNVKINIMDKEKKLHSMLHIVNCSTHVRNGNKNL